MRLSFIGPKHWEFASPKSDKNGLLVNKIVRLIWQSLKIAWQIISICQAIFRGQQMRPTISTRALLPWSMVPPLYLLLRTQLHLYHHTLHHNSIPQHRRHHLIAAVALCHRYELALQAGKTCSTNGFCTSSANRTILHLLRCSHHHHGSPGACLSDRLCGAPWRCPELCCRLE